MQVLSLHLPHDHDHLSLKMENTCPLFPGRDFDLSSPVDLRCNYIDNLIEKSPNPDPPTELHSLLSQETCDRHTPICVIMVFSQVSPEPSRCPTQPTIGSLLLVPSLCALKYRTLPTPSPGATTESTARSTYSLVA